MKLSKYVGITCVVFAVAFFGCGPAEEPELEETQEIQEPSEGEMTPKHPTDDYIINIIENPDTTIGGCIPDPEITEGIWYQDTVTFVNQYKKDTDVFMSPGPFDAFSASFPVKKGEEVKLTVGPQVKHKFFYGFVLACDPRGPGPGMGSDDPTQP